MSHSSSPPSSDASLEQRLQRLVHHQSAARAFLLVLDGPRAGRLHLLGETDTLIGRREDADIAIADAAVSQEHARVIHRPDGYYLTDLGSRNGTKLNGAPTTERKLRKKDRIQIGNTTMVFLQESAAESTLTVTVGADDAPETAHIARQSATAAPYMPRAVTHAQGVEQQENQIVALLRKVIVAFRFVKQHAWVLIPLPLAGLAIGVASLRAFPPPQSAAAIVKLDQTQQLNPVDERQNSAQRGWDVKATFFANPEGSFANSDLATDVLRDLKVDPTPEMSEAAAAGLTMVRASTGADMYMATFSQPSTADDFTSVDFLSHYLERYLTHEVNLAIKIIKAEAGFVENELKQLDAELHAVETELLDFQRKHLGALPEQAGVAIAGQGTLTMSQASAELEVDRLRMQVANAREQLAQTDTVLTRRVEDLRPVQTDLEAKKRQQSDLRAKGLRPDHPEMVQLSAQIASLEREIQSRLNAKVSDLERLTDPQRQEAARQLQQYQADLRVAEASLTRISKQVGAVAGVAAQMPMVETTVKRLKRRQEELLALRSQLFERHRKTLVQVDLEEAQVRARYEIVAPPMPQPRLNKKVLATRVGGGFGGGLVLALLIAGGIETRRLLRRHPEILRLGA